MDWLIGLMLFVIGGIIGFFVAKFVAKYVSNKTKQSSDSSADKQTIQELMNQQAAVHVQESKQFAENLIAQSTALKEQIEGYEQLIISLQVGDEGSSLNYFGEHTTAYLRNKSTKPSREKSKPDVQPLDFSSQSSGLFSGNDETAVKESK